MRALLFCVTLFFLLLACGFAEGGGYFWAAFFGLSAFALAYVQHELDKQEER